MDNLRQSIQEKPYIFLTLDFVEKMAAQLPMAEPSSLEKLNCQVTEKLNQEFLRCRLGGLYNTVPAAGICTFASPILPLTGNRPS